MPIAVQAQAGLPQVDPSQWLAASQQVLDHAPDREVDGLFQAIHASARDPDDAAALCMLFDPQSDRSLDGLDAFAEGLSPAAGRRVATALADLLVAAMQSPPQPYDAVAARQALKADAVRTAMLHDGFAASLDASGSDAAGQEARCRALRWMLDTLQARPQPERAAVTRLLLSEGLQRMTLAR